MSGQNNQLYFILFVFALFLVASVVLFFFNVASKKSGVKEVEKKQDVTKLLNKISERLGYVYVEREKKEINERDIDGSFVSRRVEKEVRHYPEFAFNSDNITLACHSSIKASAVEATLKALGPELHSMGLIPTPYLLLDTTGVPGVFTLKYASQEQLRVYDLLMTAGLVSKNALGEVVRPDFNIDEKGVIKISIAKIPLSLKDIIGALPHFCTLGYEYVESKVKYSNNEYVISPKARIDYIFDYSKPLTQQKEAIAKVVAEMRAEARKIGSPVIFAGELYDSSFNVPKRVYIPLKDSPHSLTVGMTRSGKTKGALTELFFLVLAYSDLQIEGVEDWQGEHIEFLFGDGQKSGPDFFPFLFNSSYNVATKDMAWTQPAVQLANLVSYAFKEYQERKKLAKEYGVSTVAELSEQTGKKYKRIFLIVDEFAGFITSEGDKSYFKKSIGTPGTLPNKIRELLSAGASSGVHVWLLSQRYQDTDIPTEFRSNLTNGHFYNMEIKDGANAELDEEFLKMPKGCYQLSSSGLFCADTSRAKIPVRLPYIGDRPEEALSLFFNIKKTNLKEFDMSLIAQPDQSEFAKEEQIWVRIQKAFLSNIPYSIRPVAQGQGGIRAQIHYATCEYKNKKFGLGFLEKDEIKMDYIQSNLTKEADYFIFFTSESGGQVDKAVSSINEEVAESGLNFCVQNLFVYRKALIANCIADSVNEPLIPYLEPLFDSMINAEAQAAIDSKQAENLDEAINNSSSTTSWNYNDVVAQSKTTPQELRRIEGLKAGTKNQNAKKGTSFEGLLAKYFEEAKDKHNVKEVYAGDKLKKANIITSEKEYGDGGVDLVLEHNNNTYTIIQAKAYADHNLVGVDVVDKTAIAKQYLEHRGLKLNKLAIYTTSRYTGDAIAKAKVFNVELYNFSDIQKLLNEHQAFLSQAGLKARPGRPKKAAKAEAKAGAEAGEV